jgi:hypothetical protein
MSLSEWQESLEPKTTGSWNLHQLLPKDLSFFIMLSSMSGIVGGHGQPNYAAGNTFQDALAHHRVSQGSKATSLDLAMIRTTGMLARQPKLMQHLDGLGIYLAMTEQQFHVLLEHYCDPNPTEPRSTQLICGIASPSLISSRGKQIPKWMTQPLFSSLLANDSAEKQGPAATGEYRSMLLNAQSAEEAATVVSDALVHRLARSLGMPDGDIDPSRPLHFYGVDSLVAVELRNWFFRELHADVAVFEILGNRGCVSLALFAVLKSSYRNPEWSMEGNGEAV